MELQAQQQITLFVDPLDLWLQILGVTLFIIAYWVYKNFVKQAEDGFNKAFGAGAVGLGVYILATGVWATAVWPLPGPYNILFSDSWPLLGVVLISLGLSSWFNAFHKVLTYFYAGLSLPIFVYGVAIGYFYLTRQPEIAAAMFILIGLSGLLSPLLALKRSKATAYLIIAMLIIAAVIALFIGISATFSHIPRWARWSPWYGEVVIPATS
ncbi:conserved hypothetical protein [Pyrobaculum aerophilum str. IM2]|uniref:DUF981 domain-containing protein n=2 Tax=Pyrobaculum aerophilum TaxID=13773 RepID=Q8ZUZ9_PYRAE|nr:DUF981 family protein [Pyrobaculum aerophilum]AAL64257.1 conserved hypothetical protein [Pyrobaculum aerophilum str. IM2]HII45926.1 DUF981 family protein [Pyrobaculum aerophilum]